MMSDYSGRRTANIGEPTVRRSGKSPTPASRRLLLVPGPGGVALEQAELDGEAEQLGAALEAELVTQALSVGLDGLHAHGQVVGSFLVRVPLRQQPEHLGLTPAERPGLPGSRRVAGDVADLSHRIPHALRCRLCNGVGV